MSIYFKQLKTIGFMLIACTLLSLPAYLLFWHGANSRNPDAASSLSLSSFNDLILAVSLGSLGEKISYINELDLLKANQRVEIFCETGVIGQINKHGIAKIERSSDTDISYLEDTFCSVPISAQNEEVLKAECLQNQFCSVNFPIDR